MFLDDQWSEVTIHQLIETYHIDYLVDEQHRLTKTKSSETYPTYLNEHHKSINYYILVLHLGQQGYLKHIIEMNHLGLRHTKKMKSYFVIKKTYL